MTSHEKEIQQSMAPHTERHDVAHEEKGVPTNSISAKIQNPLIHMSEEEMLRDVDTFAKENNFADIHPLLRRGALVARDPPNFTTVSGITEAEKDSISNEVLHKWRQPKILYITIILCSVGAAVQGWDQTGSNGANLSFPDALGIPVKAELSPGVPNPNAETNQWLQGLINAGPYIASAFFGCWCSDPLNNFFGRRGCIFISAVFCALSPIGSAVSQTWEQLFVTRLLLGIGMGCKGATIPIFAAENAPASIRGALVMTWQLWTAFGIFLGTVANLVVKDTGAISWRLQFGSALLPALPLLVGVFFCPESPRWYIKKGRYNEAYASLKRLRNNEIQAARDLYYIHAQLRAESSLTPMKTNFFTRFTQLFTVPRLRRATVASGTVMLAQQMCGINIIAFYSSTVFEQAGASVTEALLASMGFGAVNFVFAWPAIWTIDTFGRRTLLLFTFPQMCWSLLAAGLCYLIPSNSSAHLGLVALFVYIFGAWYSPGEGPVPFTYSAEVFPLSHREVGMSWAVATCLFWAAVLSITFPRMLAAMTTTGAFCFYAGLNLVALVLIFLFVPETKQRTLEELDYIFAIPQRRFMSHQCFTVLPWWFKTWILRKKIGPCPSLWSFEGGDDGDKALHNAVRKASIDATGGNAPRKLSITEKARKAF
ncbi:sugar transporter-like protein [Dothidotthia symphoricarpi CBS 119687]|uniref:Sugar transporter-like protein n=1 Tax=Dothidotthia symphoricarpi CBS 119687 TaxID=1392245 RepID=A0A6A6AQJ4_9PLEO|nr:sugar transporter-like protein [Dothidotthia symphoricarpi CBS 119687]KAF2134070.1 sugar transporter-like protein [Dothidotthia symphoricarpi CBS 119687]